MPFKHRFAFIRQKNGKSTKTFPAKKSRRSETNWLNNFHSRRERAGSGDVATLLSKAASHASVCERHGISCANSCHQRPYRVAGLSIRVGRSPGSISLQTSTPSAASTSSSGANLLGLVV